jgi:hypothetical protein
MAQAESKLSRAIMTALRNRGIFCFKVHGGPTMMVGLPDIIACVPITAWEDGEPPGPAIGIFIGFETKTPTGGDPEPVQRRVHDKIRAACGQVFVPRSVQDAVDALETVGWRTPPTNPS